jgi:hypothetical protein
LEENVQRNLADDFTAQMANLQRRATLAEEPAESRLRARLPALQKAKLQQASEARLGQASGLLRQPEVSNGDCVSTRVIGSEVLSLCQIRKTDG